MKFGTTTQWIGKNCREVVSGCEFITCKLSPLRWFVMDPMLPSWSVPKDRQEVGIEKPPGTVPMTVIRPSSDMSLLDNTQGAEPSVWMNSARLTTSWFSKSLSSLCMSLYPYRTTHLHFQTHWTLIYYAHQIECGHIGGMNFGNRLVQLAITNHKDCHFHVPKSKLRCKSYKNPIEGFSLFKWPYRPGPIVIIFESRMVSIFCIHSPNSWQRVSLRCSLLITNMVIYHSNIGLWSRRVNHLRLTYLRALWVVFRTS